MYSAQSTTLDMDKHHNTVIIIIIIIMFPDRVPRGQRLCWFYPFPELMFNAADFYRVDWAI